MPRGIPSGRESVRGAAIWVSISAPAETQWVGEGAGAGRSLHGHWNQLFQGGRRGAHKEHVCGLSNVCFVCRCSHACR